MGPPCPTMPVHELLLFVYVTMRQRYIVISKSVKPATMARVAASPPDRVDRARRCAPPADARLAVAVARRGADRRARAAGTSARCSTRSLEQEANPPLFYVVEWLWTRVAGTSEIALRLPSAAVRDRARAGRVRDSGGGWRRSAPGCRAGGARRGAPAARLLLAGGRRGGRGGRARVRGRVHLLPRRGRGPARRARVGARVGGGARLPLLRPSSRSPSRRRSCSPASGRASLPALAGVGVVGLGPPPARALDQVGGGASRENVTARRRPGGAREEGPRRAGSWASGAPRSTGSSGSRAPCIVAGVVLVVRHAARRPSPPPRRPPSEAAARP